MKTLVVVRHGEYDGVDKRLNKRGRSQISSLANKLKSLINGESVLILTSPVARAKESAEVFNTTFNVDVEEHEVLWSEPKHPPNLMEAMKLVMSRKDKVDVLILVTHYEYVENFPTYFSESWLGIKLQSNQIEKGEAWVIDCIQKTLTHVI